jgi:hypothetical protein
MPRAFCEAIITRLARLQMGRTKQKLLGDKDTFRIGHGFSHAEDLATARSVVMEKEVHHRGDDQQGQQEAKDGSDTAALWSDGRGVD